jgi:hypothetical protein
LLEQFHPGLFEGGGDLGQGVPARVGGAPLEVGDRFLGDFGAGDEVFLGSVEQRPGGAALRGEKGH